MKEKDIQDVLENLGTKVSILAEENRVCKARDEAGRQLITLLGKNINKKYWVEIFTSTDNTFIKEIMIEWGQHLFPKEFKK